MDLPESNSGEKKSLENENVHRLNLDGKEIILIGTAHVSRESADLVEKVIAEERPEAVCIELCRPRYDALRMKDQWQQTDILKVIREKRAPMLLSQLVMASFQRKIAQKFNITPGEEMLRAVARAEEIGAEVVLADREIRVTLLRTWRKMGFWSKVKLLPEVLLSLFATDEITEEEIEKLKKHDVLELALQTVGQKMPGLKTTLIDERDLYLAHSIGRAAGNRIVAVVGAGHVPGILNHIGEEIDIAALNLIPEKSLWGKYAGWTFSLAIVGVFVAGFFSSGAQGGLRMFTWWALITAAFSSAGALILLAHPLTIAASAVAAPITTLHPLLAAGWVAGLAEATLRKPQVKDFLALQDDIVSLRGFFRNKITRLLLLVAVVNLTTSIGTFVAIPVIMSFL